MSRMTQVLLVTGAAVIAAAIGWWWITYGEVVRYGYLSWFEAGDCLVQNSDTCSLAKALCLGTHPRTLVAYWTSAFWLGVIVIFGSLLMAGRSKASAQL